MDVREALIAAADVLLERTGYRKSSMEEIAREAGVSRAVAYHYFANKDELVLAWFDDIHRKKLLAMQLALEVGGSREERLRRVLVARVMLRYDQVQRLWKKFEQLFAGLHQPLLVARERHHNAEVDLVARALGGPEHHDTADLLVVATNAVLPYSLTSNLLDDRARIERRAHALADILLFGVDRAGTATALAAGEAPV